MVARMKVTSGPWPVTRHIMGRRRTDVPTMRCCGGSAIAGRGGASINSGYLVGS